MNHGTFYIDFVDNSIYFKSTAKKLSFKPQESTIKVKHEHDRIWLLLISSNDKNTKLKGSYNYINDISTQIANHTGIKIIKEKNPVQVNIGKIESRPIIKQKMDTKIFYISCISFIIICILSGFFYLIGFIGDILFPSVSTIKDLYYQFALFIIIFFGTLTIVYVIYQINRYVMIYVQDNILTLSKSRWHSVSFDITKIDAIRLEKGYNVYYLNLIWNKNQIYLLLSGNQMQLQLIGEKIQEKVGISFKLAF